MLVYIFYRLQGLREENLLKDGDWMAKREAIREKLPPRFTNEDIQARLKEVRESGNAVPHDQCLKWLCSCLDISNNA